MTLVWSQIKRLGMRESVEQMHPDELAQHTQDDMVDRRIKANTGGWGDHVNRMADDIRQNGYSPERHGPLRLEHNELYSRVHAKPGSAFGNNGVPGQGEFHKYHLVRALQQAGHGPVPVHVEDTRPDPNAPKRFYHGTNVEDDLDQIHPNHGTRGNFGNNLGIHEPGYAYATTKPEHAWHYAEQAAMTHGGVPRVYEVHPTGPVEKDPETDAHGNRRGNFAEDHRSQHPFNVIGEEEPPDHIQRAYYDHDEGEDEDDHHWY